MQRPNNLRELRQAQRLAIFGLAAKSGVAYPLISAIERWQLLPSKAVQERLALALEIKVEDIWPSAISAQGDADCSRCIDD